MVREFLAVLVRAVLQWALASLLLANGAAFCLIAAVASSLRLGPPCLLCARVHRLLSSSSDAGCSQEQDAFRRLLCDAHVAAITRPEPEQRTCPPSDHVDRGTKHEPDKPGGLEAHRRVVSIGSEICEQVRGGDHERPRSTDHSNLERTASIDSRNGEDPYVSMFELAPIVALPDDNQDYAKGLDETPELTASGLVAALRAQRKELEAVRAELETERRNKEGEVERRRQLEEQGEFDRGAVRIAMQLVHETETETEKHGLQRELDACRVKTQLHQAAVDMDLPPFNRLGSRRSRDAADDLIEQEDCNDNNYQSLVDFLPGSVYSSSPDLTNLLKLYTEDNGSRRPRDDDITEGSAVAAAVITEDEEEEEEVAVTLAAVSGFNGGNGEATSSVADTGASRSIHERGSDHFQAASSW